MNPAGISILYGALDRETCLAEIRLGVGEAAISCKFEIVKPLRVLDLTVFNKVYRALSLFDPEFEQKASHLEFLRKFETEVSKPILPNKENLEYIPTQAFVEYLANYYKPSIDAIIYSSTQTDEGKNIVILSHAVKIEGSGTIAGDVSEHTQYEEMWADGYSIWKRADSETDVSEQFSTTDPDTYQPVKKQSADFSLKFVQDSLEVHRVQAVQQKVESNVVFIYQRNK